MLAEKETCAEFGVRGAVDRSGDISVAPVERGVFVSARSLGGVEDVSEAVGIPECDRDFRLAGVVGGLTNIDDAGDIGIPRLPEGCR